MPPAPARDVFVILFDLKANPRVEALHTLSKVILYKQLSASKSEYKLYLINAAQLSNKSGYNGICKWDIPAKVEDLFQEIPSIETGESDWLEALDAAVHDLKELFGKPGVITLQILFITDLCSFERPNSGKLMDRLISDLTKMDIFLYVIGLPLKPPKTLFNRNDVSEWMATLHIDEDKPNLKIMKNIVNKTAYSVMCNYDIGFHLFHSFKYFKGKQPWQVPLSFGTKLILPVSTSRLSQRAPPFSLKNITSTKLNVKWAFEDDQNKIIDSVDTVSGLIKHGKFIRIESDGRFKIEGPRSFQALGFTEAKNVPEYLLQSDGSYLVMPDSKQSEEYFKFFNALVKELAESNLYIVARRVYNKDFNPKFTVLIPWNDFNLKGFILCQLPYADDIAYPYEEESADLAPKVNRCKNVFEFLDSINVESAKCKLEVPLSPTMMVYSSAIDMIGKVEEKLMNRDFAKVSQPTQTFTSEMNYEDLKNEWPQRQIELKKEKLEEADFDDVNDFDFS